MTVGVGFGSDGRAVSDVVGYVLIFSLIALSVGVVTTVGFATLEDRQDAERINNVERAFDILADNVEDVYRDGAPSRATEMRLSGGTLRYGEPVNVTIEDADAPDTNVSTRVDPIVYEQGDTEIVYMNGAILRTDGGSAVMLREPPFRTTSEQVVVPLISTRGEHRGAGISTDGTLRITTRAARPTAIPSPGVSSADTVKITVDSPRSDAWGRYFERQAALETTKNGEVLNDGKTLQVDTNRVSAPLAPIGVRFER